MKDWKAAAIQNAEALTASQLARCRNAFGPEVATVDAQAELNGMYGGSGWQRSRLEIGKVELRSRAEVIRSAWRQVLEVQGEKLEGKLRPDAARLAEKRFRGEALDVVGLAIPKPGTRFPGLAPSLLDGDTETIANELRAAISLPSRAPEKPLLTRLLEERISAAVGFLAGLIGGSAGDILRLIRSLFE